MRRLPQVAEGTVVWPCVCLGVAAFIGGRFSWFMHREASPATIPSNSMFHPDMPPHAPLPLSFLAQSLARESCTSPRPTWAGSPCWIPGLRSDEPRRHWSCGPCLTALSPLCWITSGQGSAVGRTWRHGVRKEQERHSHVQTALRPRSVSSTLTPAGRRARPSCRWRPAVWWGPCSHC